MEDDLVILGSIAEMLEKTTELLKKNPDDVETQQLCSRLRLRLLKERYAILNYGKGNSK